MKFTWFNLMPWPDLPDDFREQNRSVWVDIPSRLFDPVNVAACRTAVDAYQCPSSLDPDDTHTTYLAIITPHSAMRPGACRDMAEITDGAGNPMIVIEVDADHAVPWMSPTDADEQLVLSLGSNSKLPHAGGMHAVYADAKVLFLPADTPADTRRALISIDGNEKVVHPAD